MDSRSIILSEKICWQLLIRHSLPIIGDDVPLRKMSSRPERTGDDNVDLEAANFSVTLQGPGSRPISTRSSTINTEEGLSGDDKVWNRRVLDGFPKSAAFIVRDKDRATALYKRFDEPSMRNILYLQSRVACLTAKQAEFDKEDFASENGEITARLQVLKLNTEKMEQPRPPKEILTVPASTVALVANALDAAQEIDKQPALLSEDKDSGNKWRYLSKNKGNLGKIPEEGKKGPLFQRIADLETSIQLETPLLERLVEVNGPIPREPGKNTELREESKVQTYPRHLTTLGRERLSVLLWYIARELGIPPSHLLSYLLNISITAPANSQTRVDRLTMEAIFSLFPRPFLSPIQTTITNLEVMLQHYLRPYLKSRLVPEAAYYAAKSWEDFEMFSSPEKMRQRRLQWENDNPGTPWPFLGLSDIWIQKMQDRWYLAADLKEALKEYRKWLYHVKGIISHSLLNR